MKKLTYLALLATAAIFAACSGGGSFKKGDKGIEYKLIADGSGKKVEYGQIIQLHLTQSIKGARKDSLLTDTRDYLSNIMMLDSVSTPPEYFKLLIQMRKGDSLVIRRVVDSIFGMSPMPEYMKKGDLLQTTVKLVNIFQNKEEAEKAQKEELKIAKPKIYKKQYEDIEKGLAKEQAQRDKDDKIIAEYLAKNNIKATKAKWGTYVATITEGTGAPITSNTVVSVKYTGRTLDSAKVFDSNIDPKFGHTEPYDVPMGQLSGLIYGWFDGLMTLRNGSKATFYIPSTLGYGTQGRSPSIKPGDNLVFDIEIVNVVSEEEQMAKMEAMQKMMQEQEQKQGDSIRKAIEKANQNK